MITLRFEVEDSEIGRRFFRKVKVTEEQFDLSRFDLVDHLAGDLKTQVLAEWRNNKQQPPSAG